MVPILSGIIAGHGANVTTTRAFLLSLTYVLGMACPYTLAGIAVAAAGKWVFGHLRPALPPLLLAGVDSLGIVAVLALSACATPPPPVSPEASGLAQAESAFAAQSVASGMKAAFLEAMDDQATLFRPGPTAGKAYIAARPDPAIVLDWRPQFVTVASSGELGMSTGPWKSTSKDGSGAPSYGQFMTVWNKNSQNRWVFLMDHGVSNDGPVGWTVPLEATIADGSKPIEPMMDAETRFAAMSANVGVGRAYVDFGSNALRALRESAPLVFDPAVATHTSPAVLLDASLWTWTMTDSATAQSGDLGWVMGRYRTSDAKGNRVTGYYVRIWRSQDRRWRIVGDILAPIETAAR